MVIKFINSYNLRMNFLRASGMQLPCISSEKKIELSFINYA